MVEWASELPARAPTSRGTGDAGDRLTAAIARACRFVGEVLRDEPWFAELDGDPPEWDLLLLTGSFTRGVSDALSDLDLFLVLPRSIERRRNVAPVHVYQFEGAAIEISKVSSEKLLADACDKDGLYLWHRALVIASRSPTAEAALRLASQIEPEELRDRLWTCYALYEIYSDHLEKLDARGEPLSFSICLAEIIKLLSNAVLSSHGRFPEYKWTGRELMTVAPLVWQELGELSAERDRERVVAKNRDLRRHFTALLQRHFTDEELRAWDRCNLHRLRFQLP